MSANEGLDVSPQKSPRPGRHVQILEDGKPTQAPYRMAPLLSTAVPLDMSYVTCISTQLAVQVYGYKVLNMNRWIWIMDVLVRSAPCVAHPFALLLAEEL
ncbi:unnamed protein product [Boreogadus saida]